MVRLVHTSHLADAARCRHLLKIDRLGDVIVEGGADHLKCSCHVEGYQWEIRVYSPSTYKVSNRLTGYDVRLALVFLGEAGANKVTADLSCRLVDPSGATGPSAEKATVAASFQHASDSSEPLRMATTSLEADYVKDGCCLTMECTVSVFRDPGAIAAPPANNLPRDLGELLASGAGADVTFAVAGETFPAHRIVLAARSRVFMAAFFAGEMRERTQNSPRVEIEEMAPAVFGAMLRFVYTDAVPELEKTVDASSAALARDLLVAANRYGLDRLRVMCERRLAFGVDAANVAAMLALAERHGCSELKAKCVEFVLGGSADNLDAVLATEGFRSLHDSSPSVVMEILKAAHASWIRKN